MICFYNTPYSDQLMEQTAHRRASSRRRRDRKDLGREVSVDSVFNVLR